jgi:hypothetical protein
MVTVSPNKPLAEIDGRTYEELGKRSSSTKLKRPLTDC